LTELAAAVDGKLLVVPPQEQGDTPAVPDGAGATAGAWAVKDDRASVGNSLVRSVSLRCVRTDSRQVQPGDVFWALRGRRRDGHQFVAESLRRGAAACVVARDACQPQLLEAVRTAGGGVLVVTGDTLQSLQRLAAWNRSRQSAVVVAVTGSFGKTTTREMLAAALSSRPCVRSPNNFNNHVGVPLSLLAIESRHEVAVVEVASSAPGEVRRLAELVRPDVAVVTGVGAAHLEGLGTLDAVADEKLSLAQSLTKDGLAVLPWQDERLRRRASRLRCDVAWVDERHDASEVEWLPPERDWPFGRLRFVVEGQTFEVAAAGRHFLRSALVAVRVARRLGLAASEVAANLRRFQPVTGRCQPLRVGPWTVIDDTYNANPVSCAAACDVLRRWPTSGQRWLVLGDMLELGSASAQLHRQLGRHAAASRPDWLLLCGRMAGEVAAGAVAAGFASDRLVTAADCLELVEVLEQHLKPGDVVLVKGSRGLRMERLVQHLKELAEGERAAGAVTRPVGQGAVRDVA